MGTRTRVLLGVEDSEIGWSALRAAVAAARRHDAVLYALRSVPTPAGYPYPPLLPGQRRSLELAAEAAVRDAFVKSMGGLPKDVEVVIGAVDPPLGQALVRIADQPNDLLVIGACRHRWMPNRSTSQYCAAHASCQVMVVPAPDLARAGSPRALARAIRNGLERLTEAH